jgi:hypothetical protein
LSIPFPLVSQVWANSPVAIDISNSARATFMNPPIGWTLLRDVIVTWNVREMQKAGVRMHSGLSQDEQKN